MNVVYYSPHPNITIDSRSGAGTHIRGIVDAFNNDGHNVCPVVMGAGHTSDDSHFNLTSLVKKGKNVAKKLVPAQIWETLKDYHLIQQDKRFKARLAKEVGGFDPDIIYERANYLQPSGVRVAEKFNVPHILEVNSPYVEEKEILNDASSWFQARARSVEQEQLDKTSLVVTVSNALMKHFLHKHDVERDKFLVVPNAIRLDNATFDPDRVQKIRNRYDLGGRLVAGFVGSIFPWHGVDVLIKAAQCLREKRDNFTLLIVGDGETLPKLKRLTHKLGIWNRVVFTGRVPHEDVFNFIEVMDITVAPSAQWYQSPVKIFEYGAMGKPIIAPNTAPVREIMEDGMDGLLVDADVDDLYEALRTLAEQESLREKIAQNFHRKVMENHTWEQNVRKVLSSIANEADEDS